MWCGGCGCLCVGVCVMFNVVRCRPVVLCMCFGVRVRVSVYAYLHCVCPVSSPCVLSVCPLSHPAPPLSHVTLVPHVLFQNVRFVRVRQCFCWLVGSLWWPIVFCVAGCVDKTHQHFTHNQHNAHTSTAVLSTSVVVPVHQVSQCLCSLLVFWTHSVAQTARVCLAQEKERSSHGSGALAIAGLAPAMMHRTSSCSRSFHVLQWWNISCQRQS